MKKMWVIEDKVTGKFLTTSGGWNAEFPEAELFATEQQAVRRLRAIRNNQNPIGIVAFDN